MVLTKPCGPQLGKYLPIRFVPSDAMKEHYFPRNGFEIRDPPAVKILKASRLKLCTSSAGYRPTQNINPIPFRLNVYCSGTSSTRGCPSPAPVVPDCLRQNGFCPTRPAVDNLKFVIDFQIILILI
jgi:hypothetical protein